MKVDLTAPAARAAYKPAAFGVLLFFAMTVQTGAAAMVLCALAFLSLLGKRPLARFGKRLCVPVVGLLAFAAACGAAAIYSPFGADALGELYKLLAAFSLAVILLARFDKEDVPGLLWAFALISALIGIVSVDAAGAQLLFPAFDRLIGLLGADLSTVVQGSRQVAGIYNDANVTAFVFALGSIVCLYLTDRGEGWRQKLPAALLLGIDALAFLLSMSRGAVLSLAVALLVWLIAAGKGTRLPLFFLMAVTAMSTAVLAVPGAALVISGSFLPVLLLLVNGLLIFALDALLVRRLSALAAAHARGGAIAAAAVAVLCVGYAAAAFTVQGAYTFDATGLVGRLAHLAPGDYALAALPEGDVRVTLLGQTPYDELMSQFETLYDSASGEVAFTVPEDVTATRWQLYAPEGTVLDALTLTDGSVYRFGYPLLPTFAANRVLLGMGNSFSARWIYDMDALRLFAQAPIFGHGLASTENLYRSVQSFQYESRYVHNHLLQALSDTGLVGTVCAAAFVVGAAWLCLRAIRREKDALAAAMLAAWVMMDLHSLMEINFSVRGPKCFAYGLLTLPILLWAERPEGETVRSQKKAKTVGILVAALYVLYLAVFGGLVESARMTDRKSAAFETNDIYEYLDALQRFTAGDVFDHDPYERGYVANAVQLQDPAYNGTMMKYVRELRASGTYENDSSLARYFYLPMGQWEDLFAVSREGIRQVRSSPDGWNLQMTFYRTEVLPAMGADNVDAFVDGVLALGDALDAMNAEGRLETVSFDDANGAFLALCRSVREQGLTGENAYDLLSALAAQGEETP